MKLYDVESSAQEGLTDSGQPEPDSYEIRPKRVVNIQDFKFDK